MKFIVPTILLVLSIASFLACTNPAYHQVKALKAQTSQYDTALSNATKLQEERDALNTKYRSLSPDDLARLQKMLPDTADNIRFIIDIQQMAQSYGMTLSTIKFDAGAGAPAAAGSAPTALSSATSADVASASQDYGALDITFSTTATYENFLSFLKDIESSLRLTDVESIDFAAGDPVKGTTIFTVKLRTYWLKS